MTGQATCTLAPELGSKPEQSVSHLEGLALTSAFSILQVDKAIWGWGMISKLVSEVPKCGAMCCFLRGSFLSCPRRLEPLRSPAEKTPVLSCLSQGFLPPPHPQEQL